MPAVWEGSWSADITKQVWVSGQWTGSLFDPETSLSWHSLFWAEGTQFALEGYTDGVSVIDWPNETGEVDATQATATYRGIYDADGLGGQPAVVGDSSDWYRTPSFTSNPTYPISIIAIAATASTSGNRVVVDGIGSSNRNLIYRTSGNVWQMYGGASLASATTPNTAAHLHVGYFTGDSGNEWYELDGVSIASGSDAGSQTLTGVTLMGDYSGANEWVGHLAFLGIYEGDITQDSSWSDFTAWVTTHYGISI